MEKIKTKEEIKLYALPIVEVGKVALLSEVEVAYWIVQTKGFGRIPRNGEEALGAEF